ncbi:hypothetical protein [Arthrobacter alpinus]|uniref:hypothetical protein n=1 Tax=Arthrobacter alpinus TaxID=656366 RepID=UPI001645BEA9|nr:hypothetical protein [Arthrobacter alpinus]
MSMQPPWPGQSGENPPQLAPQQPGPRPYGQPYFAVPGGTPPAPKKSSALPWILGGVAVVVFVVIAVVLVLFLAQWAKPGTPVPDAQEERTQETTLSATTAATFSYPASWVETGKNVTSIESDGSSPAERLVLADGSKDTAVLAVYAASGKPQGDVTTEKIHDAIDMGFQGQLDASPQKLVDMRSTSGFGCTDTFNYTEEPAIVDRVGLYGYSYGYTCNSYRGPIQGEYVVAYDTTGVVHRLTVEALAAQWAANAPTLQAIIPSLTPAG